MKAMRCIRGELWDVIVDLRPGSPSYMQSFGAPLSADNRQMLVMPEGCANRFQTLVDDTEAFYLVSKSYAAEFEVGIRWDDPAFNLDWPVEPTKVPIKDTSHPDFQA